jgi:NTP pyrophosphatase (non-canonical NTP hydrolase)
MNLNEYQNLAAETAFYPGRNANLPGGIKHEEILKCSPIPFPGYVYTILGLIGELTELKECANSSTDDFELPEKDKEKIVKELGDCFWYLSQFTMELGIPFSQIESRDAAWKIEYYGPHYNCGLICELVKKTIRDNNGNVTPIVKEKILKELRIVYSYLLWFCKIYNIDTNHVMEENIKKLFSRRDRGVLGGSGNER